MKVEEVKSDGMTLDDEILPELKELLTEADYKLFLEYT